MATFAGGLLLLLLRPSVFIRGSAGDIVQLQYELDPKENVGNTNSICENYPKLTFTSCTHNNLALKGPDMGDEGVVFAARNMWTGHEFEVVVNAISSYKPFSTRRNGMSGEYGTLNLVSGSSVKVKFSVRDQETKEPLVLPYFSLTFFDLDQGLSGTSQESVTVSNFTSFAISDDVHPGSGTEVRAIRNKDGSRTFKSSTFGTGADNPKHPLDLNRQQKNRAVSLRFRDFRSVDITFAASAGIEPRFFTFVAYPALVCSETYQNKQLMDLKYGKFDTPVVAERDDIFEKFFVKPGDHVKEGSELFSTEKPDGSVHVYRSGVVGEVIAIQAGLKSGDLLSQRLDDKTVVVLTKDVLKPLPVEPGGEKTVAPSDMAFSKYHVAEGDVVVKGDPIADVVDENGQVTTLTASKSGPIAALQANLKTGDNTNKLTDGNVATIGRLPALPVAADSKATTVPPGCTFVRYLADVGDTVDVNTPIAEVEVGGKVEEVQSAKAGTVTARQEELKKGMSIDEALMDHNILVVGSAEEAAPIISEKDKLVPLEAKDGEHMASVPHGMIFEGWHKDVGDTVRSGDPLLYVKNANGDIEALDATGTGVVMARQEKLKQGDRIDDVMRDTNLMVVGKLAPLKVGHGEAAAEVPAGGDYTFKEFLVAPGDVVREGDSVAAVTDPEGRIHFISSPKYGTVKERQEQLTDGASISGVMKDRNLVTVGKFPCVQPSGPRVAVVEAPKAAIFNKWYVQEGDKVELGDKIAQVTLPEGPAIPGRRLAPGFGGVKMDIPAPTWGTVSGVQPLKPGKSIGEQQEGTNIATLDQGLPWWLGLLGTLSVLFCALCILFGVMNKPLPYQPMAWQETPEPLLEEPKPEGLRLDFEDGSKRVHTVYAKCRPLGIKHNKEAPIVANDFTINSYAKLELGVKEGWKLRRIGDEELYDNPNFREVEGKLNEYMKDLELWSLPIDFRSPTSQETTTVEFRVRPIGIEFTNKAPIKVRKITPNTPAQVAHIQEGSFVTRIGEADVAQNANFKEVMGYLHEGVQPLDEATGTNHITPVLRSNSRA